MAHGVDTFKSVGKVSALVKEVSDKKAPGARYGY